MPMIRYFLTGLAALALVAGSGCSDSPSNPNTPSEPNLAPPFNLRAWSDDSTIGILWNASVDEPRNGFGAYAIDVWDKATDRRFSTTAPKGTTTLRIRNLTNGDRYLITAHAVSSGGRRGDDSSSVEWSPAKRVTRDINGSVIRVYATTSAFPSAVDLLADSAHAELLDMTSAAFATRGDLFVYAPNFVGECRLMSPSISGINPGQLTQFSSVPVILATSLNDAAATSSPSFSTYTLTEVVIDNAWSEKGKIYFGRTQRGSAWYYFRVFLKPGTDGFVVQGAGSDRYIVIEASFQSVRNVPFAKR